MHLYRLVEFDIGDRVMDGDDAWGVQIDGKLVWFPKHLSELFLSDPCIRVPEWLAIEKELV